MTLYFIPKLQRDSEGFSQLFVSFIHQKLCLSEALERHEIVQ